MGHREELNSDKPSFKKCWREREREQWELFFLCTFVKFAFYKKYEKRKLL